MGPPRRAGMKSAIIWISIHHDAETSREISGKYKGREAKLDLAPIRDRGWQNPTAFRPLARINRTLASFDLLKTTFSNR